MTTGTEPVCHQTLNTLHIFNSHLFISNKCRHNTYSNNSLLLESICWHWKSYLTAPSCLSWFSCTKPSPILSDKSKVAFCHTLYIQPFFSNLNFLLGVNVHSYNHGYVPYPLSPLPLNFLAPADVNFFLPACLLCDCMLTYTYTVHLNIHI